MDPNLAQVLTVVIPSALSTLSAVVLGYIQFRQSVRIKRLETHARRDEAQKRGGPVEGQP